LEYLDVDGKIILKSILKKYSVSVWTGLIWLRTGTSGSLLWTWKLTIRFHKILGNSWSAAKLLASQDKLCSVVLGRNHWVWIHNWI
jgi:hypothetical protein